LTGESTSRDLLAATAALLPLIRESRDEIERQRRVSEPVVQGMADAGIFKAFYPRSLGGLEVDPMTLMEVVEEISRVDGSVGWCAMITSGAGWLAGGLKHQVAAELFGQPPDVRLAGIIIPRGEAFPVDGGYKVSGHFTFASGIDYANWLMFMCKIVDEKGPILTAEGIPKTILAFAPIAEADVRDTWSAVGLCATGSHDFHLNDAFIPVERSFSMAQPPNHPGPLFNPRTFLTFAGGTLASCFLGIGRGAMDTFLESVAGSGTNMSPTRLQDRPAVHAAVGQAEASLSSARAYLFDSVEKVWAVASDGKSDPIQKIAQVRLAVANAFRESARAVDLLFEAAGTTAVFQSHPMERYHRDIHVAAKQWIGNAANFDLAGQVLLGQKPAGAGW
jgi:alkylation response protein AidB-like acyl-CoA dehydrogenase